MENLGTIALIAIAFIIGRPIYQGFKKGVNGSNIQHCMTCGIDGEPETVTKGSIFIEIVLWLCLLVPGIIYSIWRLTSKQVECKHCHSTSLVPANSPAAIAHKKQLGMQ